MYGSWVRIPARSQQNSVLRIFCLRGEIGRHAILRGWFPKDVLVRVQSQAQKIQNHKFIIQNFEFGIMNFELKTTDLVAQLVEQYTFNVWVLGSNPSQVTITS